MTRVFGGGELLRACLHEEAVDSYPYFYNLLMTGNDGGAAPFTTTTTTLQTENDSAFLMTSIWAMSSNSFADQPEYLGIYDASKQGQFINAISPGAVTPATLITPSSPVVFSGIINDSLANCMTLPEYVLWGPNSLIGATWFGRNGSVAKYRYAVLGGIKYYLKGP